MKNVNTIILIFALFTISCQEEDNSPLNPTNKTTYFGKGEETYHTGIDSHHNTSHYYKRDHAGNIVWSLEINMPASYSDQIIVLPDGSSILYALGNDTFYKISATGQLVWENTFADAYFNIYINEDHLWIPFVEHLSMGMFVIDLQTGEQISKVVLSDIYKPQLQQYSFSYKDGAVYLAAYMGYSHVDLIKFDETGLLWRESNDKSIDDSQMIKVLPLTEGLAILFHNSVVCKFDADGVFIERYTLETAEEYDLTYTTRLIQKKDGVLELFALNPDNLFSLTWITLDAEGKLQDSKSISLPYEVPFLADYTFTDEGVLLSVFNIEDDTQDEDRILLKNDGTFEVIL